MLRRLELPRDEMAPALARKAVDDLCPPLDLEAQADARLLISELVSNSVIHGDGDSIVLLIDAERPDLLRCEVVDDGRGFVPRGRGDRSVGGWGLDPVEQMACSWGVREGSTHVWFELPVRSSR